MSDPRPDIIIEARALRKTYRLGRVQVEVLKGVDIAIERGSSVAVLGKSGSGKSTLLHLLGGLDRPDRPGPGGAAPAIRFNGVNIAAMRGRGLSGYRCTQVGFVFQFYHLLPELAVLENVTIGAMIRHGRLGYRGRARAEAERTARELLDTFGLSHRLRHRPAELSGGERQRVAIARALVNRPALLLADEPTGNLDRATGATILDALTDLRRRLGLTLVTVTHDESVAARADRTVRLADGCVTGDAGPLTDVQ